jgi:hypothetical protein
MLLFRMIPARHPLSLSIPPDGESVAKLAVLELADSKQLFHSLGFVSKVFSLTPIVSITSPLFAKTPGGYPQKAKFRRNPNETIAPTLITPV